MGGTSDDGSSDRASLFDPATGSFSPTGFMSASRLGQSATLQGDGTVLIFSGGLRNTSVNGTGPALQSAEIYDPVTGTFSMTGNMMTARGGPAASLLPDGITLVAGGSPGVPPNQPVPSTTAGNLPSRESDQIGGIVHGVERTGGGLE